MVHQSPPRVLQLCVYLLCAWSSRGLLPSCVAYAQDPPAEKGRWSAVKDWRNRNVPIHANLLPNGKVLFWGRRENGNPDLNVRTSTPWLWDPVADTFVETGNRPGYNLFCSGHTFMADGKLFVAGGHQKDGQGEPIATTYDYRIDRWERIPKPMKGGRWYPTATTLPDGGILVSFGTKEDGTDNNTQEIWKDGDWTEIVNFGFPPYYPRMHVIPDGNVFMTGPLALTQILDPDAPGPMGRPGGWSFLRPGDRPGSERQNFAREYGPSVMYDEGKVIYIGGGNAPTAACEIVDVQAADRRWRPTGAMTLARRQHNATLLPDGKVLVTGGTKGDGDRTLNPPPNIDVPAGPGTKFNDLRPGEPLRSAEVWDPATRVWTRLARASVDRCYHSVTLLLPDATVLSGGGGEYSPYDGFHNNKKPNHPNDTHADAQIFSPPYLFDAAGNLAPRPAITAITPNADEIHYGDEFTVGTPNAATIRKVSWIRLGSVTHTWDAGQRMNVLNFAPDGMGGLKVTAPGGPNVCPPGHYMLFLINDKGVPSLAKIIRIGA